MTEHEYPQCEGAGVVEMCRLCDGYEDLCTCGWQEHDTHDVACSRCDGKGFIEVEDEDD